ncbi:MAG: tryptophan 7-halogenase [Burkholderiales bacterium]|nr:tryptophan 7-halogenase [Burkholderiales bacterium]
MVLEIQRIEPESDEERELRKRLEKEEAFLRRKAKKQGITSLEGCCIDEDGKIKSISEDD